MSTAEPIPDTQRKTDAEHLRLLSIFHYVVGGLCFAGLGFLFLHFLFLFFIFSQPEMGKGAQAPPAAMFGIFIIFYIAMGACLVAAGLLNCLSGRFLSQRKHYTFSLVVAALDCWQMPFGTVLGVFTIVVLMRDSVRQAYDENAASCG